MSDYSINQAPNLEELTKRLNLFCKQVDELSKKAETAKEKENLTALEELKINFTQLTSITENLSEHDFSRLTLNKEFNNAIDNALSALNVLRQKHVDSPINRKIYNLIVSLHLEPIVVESFQSFLTNCREAKFKIQKTDSSKMSKR